MLIVFDCRKPFDAIAKISVNVRALHLAPFKAFVECGPFHSNWAKQQLQQNSLSQI